MVVFPNCKINLGLRIIRKRDDGFHDIESLLYPVSLTDVLEIVPAEKETMVVSGKMIRCEIDDNLVWKAYQLMKKKYGIPSVSIHLHKVIPDGAGLGGGSSDAAFTITSLSEMFIPDLTETDLIKTAGELGSDCPFFIMNRPAIAAGRGDVLTEFPDILKSLYIYLIKPEVSISTRDAYAAIHPGINKTSIPEILSSPVNKWKDVLKNDFEGFVQDRFPQIEKIKTSLYHHGAIYVSMSGSGSAVYGIFEEKPLELPRGSGEFHWVGEL